MRLTLLAILMAAAVADFREMKISNRLIAFGLFLGLAFRILVEGSAGIVHFLVNISILSISNARIGRRRYQVIFRGRWIFGGWAAVCVDDNVVFGGRGHRNCEALMAEGDDGKLWKRKNSDTFFTSNLNWIFCGSLGVCL